MIIWTKTMPSWFWTDQLTYSRYKQNNCGRKVKQYQFKNDHHLVLKFTAKFRCLVDGGANRWLNFLEKYHQLGKLRNPDLMTGDFDSITDRAMTFFKQISTVRIIDTPSQNHTDFTKSLMILPPYILKYDVSSYDFMLAT